MRTREDRVVLMMHHQQVEPLRLLLIDDHSMLTEALASRLSSAADLWVAGRCTATDPNLPGIVRSLKPDVITIEVEPLGLAIGTVLRQLAAIRPAGKIVVLSADRNVCHAVEAARAGAAAWVPKERGAAELETVLRGVHEGKSWFPPEMLGEILSALRADARRAGRPAGPLDMLSSREHDVLLGLMEGKRRWQIAQELMISAETVRTHTRNIFAKLDVHSSLEAVRAARAAGLRPGERRP